MPYKLHYMMSRFRRIYRIFPGGGLRFNVHEVIFDAREANAIFLPLPPSDRDIVQLLINVREVRVIFFTLLGHFYPPPLN